ncbi:hypothetical protein [Streptomyces sp. NBC_00102]|uniref:hypothetical protein n=1 Tax=Streptomyces sp. NBC_00102 TaxID=2975652 RepID=UPI00224DA080|nr:hypothetical protein [Streptomyces sp. NBC_00102]MCX5397077.1 hypothetical protein [Streptomyces sp. NBC_00102]
MNSSVAEIVNKESLLKGLSMVLPNLETSGRGLLLVPPAAMTVSRGDVRAIEPLTDEEIDEVINSLSQVTSNTHSSFNWHNRGEFTIAQLNVYSPLERHLEKAEFIGQSENPVIITVGYPSKEVAAYLLCYIANNAEIAQGPRWRVLKNRLRRALSTSSNLGEGSRKDDTILGLVGEILDVTSLRVSSAKPRADYEDLATSLLFHIAYNTGMAATIGINPLLEVGRMQRVRRSVLGSIDAPRQTYTPDLVHHYLMGVAAEIPLLEYLSYYHIAEHYFDKVFNDDLIEQVRRGITDPSFSVRRARDVNGIIKIVNRAQRQVKDEGGVNEQRALQLVLNRFVDTTRLVDDLTSYDDTLVDYYRNTEVAFAGAPKLDLGRPGDGSVLSSMAKRIYKVRNSLVHAKEGELPKYAPFSHDTELSREIPLMRFAAEQIIIFHGKPL